MKLYLISQDVRDGYDTYDSAIVAAEDEESARRIHPSGNNSDWEQQRKYTHWGRTWCKEPHQVNIRLLGEAAPGTNSGVILASFNAG